MRRATAIVSPEPKFELQYFDQGIFYPANACHEAHEKRHSR